MADDGPIPLSLSTTNVVGAPTVSTRGINTAYQSTNLVNANTLGIYIRKIDETTPSSPVINTAAKVETYEKDNISSSSLTAATYGTTNYTDVTTSTLYYPDVKTQKIQIYAYAPTSIMPTTAATTIGSFNIDMSSSKDQSTNAGYMANDIIWGTEGTTNEISANYYKNTAAATAGTVTGAYVGTGTDKKIVIPMSHKGSKIVINLIPLGMDLTKLQNASVSFFVDYTKGSMNLSTGAITTYDGTATNYSASQEINFTKKSTTGDTGLGYNVSNPTDEGAYADGTPATLKGYTCCGVILPQPVNATTTSNSTAGSATYKLIEITLSDGTTKYAFTTGAVQNFESGKVYTYTITVTATELYLTTKVDDWLPGTSANGSAVLQ